MWQGEVGLKLSILLIGEEDLLGVEGASELLGGNISLSKSVMVLEELKKTDTILLNDVLDLDHQLLHGVGSAEVGESGNVGRLGTSGWSIDNVLEAVGISKELSVLDLIDLISIDKTNVSHILLVDLETKSSQDLSEDLLGDLEVSMSIEVLEETLGIKSVLSDELSEFSNDSLNICNLLWSGLKAVILGGCSSLSNWGIKLLLKTLLGENLINIVAEVSPSDMLTSLWCSVGLAELAELLVGDWDLGHAESHSELVGGDKAGSELVEISEELTNSDSLLRANLANSCKNIINIDWLVAHDLSLAHSGLSLWEVVEAVVEVLTNLEQLLGAVHILTEIDIVDLVDVTQVHVSLQEGLEDMLWGEDSESVKDSHELGLGDMAVLGDVEVLEDWLEVDSHGLDSLSVLLKDGINLVSGCWVGAQVLSSGEEGVVGGDGGNLSGWGLVNTSDSEGLVDVGDKLSVLEEALWVVGGVLLSKGLKLIVGQGEVELGEDGFELSAGDSALSELVKISEELLNSDSSLNDSGTESILNIIWVVENLNSWLAKSVVDDIHIVSSASEEAADLGWGNTEHVDWSWLWSLGLVGWEHVLWAVEILAEFEVVDFLVVSTVTVLPDHQVKHLVALWHQVELFEDAQELLLGDVLTLRPVKVHEVWLQKDSVCLDNSVEVGKGVNHGIHLGLVKFLQQDMVGEWWASWEEVGGKWVLYLQQRIWHFE